MYRAMILLLFMNTWVPTCESPTSYYPSDGPPLHNARTSIRGIVYDDSAKRPLEGVQLSLQPPPPGYAGYGSSSNGDGLYEFSDLGNGLWKIITDKSGYLTETVTVRTYADSVITKDIYLTASGG